MSEEKEKHEKKEDKEKQEKQNKKEHPVKKHLNKKVSLPFYVILGIILLFFVISLFAIRVPYKAKEKYSEIENYVIQVEDIVQDKDNPQSQRICEEQPYNPKITELFVYGKKYGLSSYKCYAEFKVVNENNTEGDFVYKFVFNVNGKTIETEEKKEFILKYSMKKYYFEADCQDGDKPTGEPVLISAPKTKICHYETIYPNVTIVRNETRQREVLKERIVEKTESLFERLIGKNNAEKIK